MLWLLVPFILGLLYYVLFWNRNTVRNGRTDQNLPSNKEASATRLSPETMQLKERLGLDEINRPISIALLKVCTQYNTFGMKIMMYKMFFSSQSELQNRTLDSADQTIHELEKLAKVHIIVEASSDDAELEVKRKVLEFLPSLPSHRCLVYSTPIGKMAIVRQLNSSLHVDYDVQFCGKVKPHLKKILLIDALSAGAAPQHLSAVKFSTGAAGSADASSCQPSTKVENVDNSASIDNCNVPISYIGGFPSIRSVSDLLTVRIVP